ncbi:MAG: ribonuclease P protein component [bacterium]|nr:ribonuclease P protein component [bacterium]
MLKKANRFYGRVSLLRVFRKGRVIRNGITNLKFAPNSNGSKKVAVVVSKKVSKHAVVRNRIRRRVYEFIRLHENQLEPGDYVISVFDACLADCSSAVINKELSNLLLKAKVVKATSSMTNKF